MGVKTQLPSVHWAYYPEKQYPFYRIGFPHNLTPSVAPAGCSSLIGEFAHLHKPRAWVQAKTKQTKEHIKKLFTINDEEILMEHIMHIDHAYVIYDFWREKNLPKIHARLHEQSIYSVGRYGEWKYSSMQEGVLDGKQIADALTIMPARRVECATTITAQHSEHTKTIKKDTHDRIV
jgi:protoporphyrinogen oxidase